MNDTKKHDLKIFESWSFGKINYLIFGIGILVIVIGYLVMVSGDTTSFQSVKLAPIILVIGYCILIPVSILYKPKK